MKKRKVNTPTVFQMEVVECGAASLAMILGYFGCFVPLEELRVDCGISRNGSKAINIVKAAKKYNLNVKAFSKEPKDLYDMPLPMIIFWNFYHFVVLEGFSKDKVYLNDPACGKRKVSYEEFDRSFTGVVLTFSPNDNFAKKGEKNNFKASLKAMLQPFSSSVLFLVLTGAALILPNLAVPVLSRIFIDEIWIKQAKDWFMPLLAGLAFTALLRGIITWIQQQYLIKLEFNIAVRTAAKYFKHILKLPAEFFMQRSPNELGQRLQLCDSSAQMMTGQLANTLLSLLMIIFYSFLLAWYDLELALITLGFAAINFVALKYFSERRKDENQVSLIERGNLYAFSAAGLQMIETIKATSSEREYISRWTGLHSKLINSQQRMNLLSQTLNLFPVLLSSLSSIAVLIIGSLRIMDKQITVGTLVAIQSISASLMLPVNMLVNLGSTLQMIEGGLKRLFDAFNYPVEKTIEDKQGPEKSRSKIKLDGYLELKNITFGYNRLEAPLISDFSLFLKPGSRVAIVGKTGSGKSTISKLVSGLYKPWDGEILFDGKKRDDFPAVVLHHSISMVDQDIFLFEGSVTDNISFWDSTISEKDIINAGKDAEIHDDIAERPGGYDSFVEEGGRNFSGGQRQRIDIARALVNKPTLLILDEATSALDAKTEKLIDDNIRRRGCTCLIIAHRLSTIRDCDEIIVLDNGKVVQRGTHDRLKNEPGLYAELIKG